MQESDTEEVSIRPAQASTSCVQKSNGDHEVIIQLPLQAPTSMHVPYIEGPKINCTVDDGLYNRFII